MHRGRAPGGEQMPGTHARGPRPAVWLRLRSCHTRAGANCRLTTRAGEGLGGHFTKEENEESEAPAPRGGRGTEIGAEARVSRGAFTRPSWLAFPVDRERPRPGAAPLRLSIVSAKHMKAALMNMFCATSQRVASLTDSLSLNVHAPKTTWPPHTPSSHRSGVFSSELSPA